MSENTCSVCNEAFEEKYFDKEQNKCILHCEKDSWYELTNNHDNWYIDKKMIFFVFFLNYLKDKERKYEYLNEKFKKRVINPNPDEIYIFDVIFPQHVFYEKKSTLLYGLEGKSINFFNCQFVTGFRLFDRTKEVSVRALKFYYCFFKTGIDIRDISIELLCISDCNLNENSLYLENVTLGEFITNSTDDVNNYYLKEINIKEYSFISIQNQKEVSLSLINSKVKKIDFQFKKANLLDLKKSTFIDKVSFVNKNIDIVNLNQTVFLNEVSFTNTTFKEKANFINAIFKKKLDLSNTFFTNEVNFLNISSEKNVQRIISVENRETARIIKNSFEQQNNIIEANKFYALEMKEREKELDIELNENKNLYEWFVFKIHGIASNHSQDWFLSLLMILIFGICASIYEFSVLSSNSELLKNLIENYTSNITMYKTIIGGFVLLSVFLSLFRFFYNYEKIVHFTLISTLFLIYLSYTKDIKLVLLSHTINPFSIMTSGDTLDGLQLFFKIIIGYLLYQLIVSVRQNTRRK